MAGYTYLEEAAPMVGGQLTNGSSGLTIVPSPSNGASTEPSGGPQLPREEPAADAPVRSRARRRFQS
jgi:hypothetical protein